ncbi:sensor histidine kinase [Corynebacterium yudongzhengii]|uniref:Sensor histidine kinase n=1 Tax=Corynebacterium yudongzhengii TaxID=2080740 RepID=A0A2U1T7Z6_9CORY|nr:sensor histidine kinase [Corynebacterium yudongzhengii]AWB82813.1 sensor histidine kinase [Corynebacterium yudongzhengii]PWC02127.1 sensor histidine kinase [Corynebacterium yudongzhengii]
MSTPLPGVATDEDGLRNGIHIFTAVLLMVAVASSFQMALIDAAINLILIAAFAAVYFLGSIPVDSWPDGKKQAWIVLLTALWIGEMVVSPVGIYLVFTLFFVYLQVLDELRGVISVVFAASVAVIMQIPNGLTFGGIMGPAVSAVISLAVYYAYRSIQRISSEREQLINQLMDTRAQLAQSEHDQGVIAERQRLAHEIHDTVAQGLSSIQLLLHAAEREVRDTNNAHARDNALERIDQARRAASENLAEARAMIAALTPDSLSRHSLKAALERMADSFGQAGELSIEVDIDGEVRELPMPVEAALLRIAQGAVGNVVKHAEASRCRITVTYEEDEVRLDVVDNGRGFDLQSVRTRRAEMGHVGVEAMRRRAEERGGQLTMESQPGGPTAVSAVLPTPVEGFD